MLELRELRFSGIGRFVEEQTIDFSSLNEFIQVDGQNNNTKGSSGSGKTTVFNSLDYLLGLNDLPSTILQSRFTEENLSVSGIFLWNGKEVSVSRSKKLKVIIDDKTIEGSSALAEEAIDQILGMPRKIFRKLLHKRQKEGGFFLDFTPQKMHEFLIDCLDLSAFRSYDELEDVKIKSWSLRKSTEEAFLNGQQVGLDATVASIASLGPAPTKEIDQEMIVNLKNRMNEAEIALRSILDTHKLNQNELEKERPNTTVIPFDRSNIELAAKTKRDLEDSLNALFQSEKDRISKVKELIATNKRSIEKNESAIVAAFGANQQSTKIAEEIKKIRSSICPTCEQTWITEQYSNQEKERITQLLRLKTIIDSGTLAGQDLIALNEESERLKEDVIGRVHSDMPDINAAICDAAAIHLKEKLKEDEWIEKQNIQNSNQSEKFAQKQRQLQQIQSAEADQARGQLELTRRVFDGAVAKLRSYEEARVRHENNLKDLKSKEEKFTKKIEEVQKEIAEISQDLLLAEETKKAIKMFLSYSFDDALEAIGSRATEIIRCIPNMSCATIQFDGTKETKDGKIKEEVNAVIGMDGEESVPIKSLSGGERSAVDIAVDLAVIDFIELKSGKGINIFILDEPFTGLGPVEIEMALEVLKNSNTNKKIVIVDHNSEVKQMVQNRLVVVRDGLTSKIEKGT